MTSSSLEQTAKRSAPAVNESSGEEMVSFKDCRTVRDARERRVTRILAASPAVDIADIERPEDANDSTPEAAEAAVGLPVKVRTTKNTTIGVDHILLRYQ